MQSTHAVGVVWPGSPDPEDIEELQRFVPSGVALRVAGTRRGSSLPGKITLESVLAGAGASTIEEAAKHLVPAGVEAIAYACTSHSYVRGIGGDREIAARIEAATGVPATTTSSAAVVALRHLGVSRVGVLSPHISDLNVRLQQFLEDSGFRVLRLKGLEMYGGIEQVPPGTIRELAKDSDGPDVDGIFISCTGMRTATIVDALEEEFGKPVVTANHATMWELFRLAGVFEPKPGRGMLFRSPARSVPVRSHSTAR